MGMGDGWRWTWICSVGVLNGFGSIVGGESHSDHWNAPGTCDYQIHRSAETTRTWYINLSVFYVIVYGRVYVYMHRFHP